MSDGVLNSESAWFSLSQMVQLKPWGVMRASREKIRTIEG